jgi:hypothetical protein
MNQGPSNPTSLLNLLASTGQQIEFFSSSIVNEVKNGNESPLRVLIQLRAMEKASKAILDGIREEIITAAEKYPGKDFELWGNKLSKEELGIKYDYSTCGDTIYERLQTDFDTAKSRLDERTAFLRALKSDMTVVDELTGEIVTILPPKKTSTSGVKVTIR